VFFVDVGGQHGLIAAKADQNGGAGIQWFNGTYFVTNATADGLYAGAENTGVIISTQTTVGLSCSELAAPAYCIENDSTAPATIGNYAALVAANYSIQENGVTPCNGNGTRLEKCYGDWYLPSKNELNLMYKNIGPYYRGPVVIDRFGFAASRYWSSTESGAGFAWSQTFFNEAVPHDTRPQITSGMQINANKTNTYIVRAVRAF
jgi:hypothetical protein